MNKFVELSLELNFHANWHLPLLFTIVFDSIYLCTLMSAFWISSEMLCISTDCNWMLSDPFPGLGTCVVELFLLSVAGVGEVLMWSRTVLEAATIIPTIRAAFTNNSVKHVLAFLKFKREEVFCLSVGPIYPIFASVSRLFRITDLLWNCCLSNYHSTWSSMAHNKLLNGVELISTIRIKLCTVERFRDKKIAWHLSHSLTSFSNCNNVTSITQGWWAPRRVEWEDI